MREGEGWEGREGEGSDARESWLMWQATDRYFELLKESKVKGYLFQQQNYVP